MKLPRVVPLLLLSAVGFAACASQEKVDTLVQADSLHVDSLGKVRQQLVNEVIASTQFIADINSELAKARSLSLQTASKGDDVNESAQTGEQRKQIVARITRLVSSLEGVQARLASTRTQVAQLSQKDSTLMNQVAEYEKNIASLQATAEKQRADFQAVIDGQAQKIVALNGTVDTLTHVRADLTTTVEKLTTEKNTAYYVIGTKDELIKQGILVAEGSKRFLIVGPRSIVPARDLDPTKFTKIDRTADRTITLPAGEFQILSRQNPAYVAPATMKDGKITGGLTIDQPEQFWEPSRFLIIVRT